VLKRMRNRRNVPHLPEGSLRILVYVSSVTIRLSLSAPAPVETVPSQAIAARYPLCHDHRRYLPSEVFLGRLSALVIRKPVTTADGRVG
jgi:hypothetical protein